MKIRKIGKEGQLKIIFFPVCKIASDIYRIKKSEPLIEAHVFLNS